MSNLNLQDLLRKKVVETASEVFNVRLDNTAAEVPPRTELGDLAFPVAFELAKQIKQQTGEKKNPRELAEKLKAALETFDKIEKVEVAGAGYLNVFYNRAAFLNAECGVRNAESKFSAQRRKIEDQFAMSKVCVEHTSVNPNKAAHIGHVRNSVLGDTFVRILKADGKLVEVQNYIDNTGVQVADVVVGFIYLEKMDLDNIVALDKKLLSQGKSFDYFCWDLYTKVGLTYQTDEELKSKRAEVLHLIEEGNNTTSELADYVATRNVQCILATMDV
jgi:arginyl-tRNA synthetase